MTKKLLLLFCVAAMAGCYKDTEEELYPDWSNTGGNGCDTANISYATDIQPIFNQHCAMAGCHDAQAKSAGYDLSAHAGAKLASGRLVGVITQQAGFSPMPKGAPKLDNCKIAKVRAWVNAGTPDN